MRVPFDPPPGLTSDDTTFSSPGRWADGSNVRFVKGRPESIGGWAEAFATDLTGTCRNIKIWTDNDGSQAIAFGTHSALQVYFGGSLYTITPSGLAAGNIDSSGSAPGYGTGTYGSGPYSTPQSQYYARTWSLDTWGENLVAVPRGGTLYRWQNDTAVLAAAVSNAPSEITVMLVTPERQVIAFGCNEVSSGTFNPLCIRGCDIENITSWTPSASNNSFEDILEGSGHIIAARLLGPYVAVWTNVSLYIGQFVGNFDQTYRWELVASNTGCISPNAVHVVGMTAYWVGIDRQLRSYTPGVGSQPIILPCPIFEDFNDNLNEVQSAKTYMHGLSKYNEFWVHYPDERDGSENSRYLAFGIEGDSLNWFKGQLARTTMVDAGVAAFPVAVDSAGAVYYHEHSTTSVVTWHIQSADQYIQEGEQMIEVQRFIPDFENQENAVSLTLYMKERPRSSEVTKGPYSIATTDTKKDFRASGFIMAVKLSGTGQWRSGKPVFEAVATGRR